MPSESLVMSHRSSRYGSKCERCGNRIRHGKRFVIDPVDSTHTYHAECFVLAKRKG